MTVTALLTGSLSRAAPPAGALVGRAIRQAGLEAPRIWPERIRYAAFVPRLRLGSALVYLPSPQRTERSLEIFAIASWPLESLTARAPVAALAETRQLADRREALAAEVARLAQRVEALRRPAAPRPALDQIDLDEAEAELGVFVDGDAP